jgi:hypothetical protein
MRRIDWIAWAILLVLSFVVLRSAQGAEIVDTDHYLIQCAINGITGQFSNTESRYNTQGICTIFLDYNQNYPANQRGESTFDNQKLYYQFLWSALGTYNLADKGTVENISIGFPCNASLLSPYSQSGNKPCASPPPVDAQPGHGATSHITSRMACTQDPWREPAGACGSVHTDISGYRGEKSGPDFSGPGIYEQGLYPTRLVPRTSLISADQRASLKQQYTNYVAALRKAEEIRQATISPQSILSQTVFPSILSPAKGQRFVAQNTIPIKLAPPNGWNATGYTVNVLINGYSCNLPVGAAQAQSPTGYTGFGAGKPPCFLAIPGSYRLRAQIDSPRQSGWSDWVDFTVTPPRVSAPAGIFKK